MADEGRINSVDQDDRHTIHVHTFNTITNVADDHQHIMQAVTGPAREAGNSHVHRVRGRTSFFAGKGDGHWHWFDVVSGPAIDMPDDTHTHYFEGDTSRDCGHCHSFVAVAGLAPDCDDDTDDDTDCDDNHHKSKNKKYREDGLPVEE